MAKAKDKEDPETSPYVDLKKTLLRYQICAGLGIVICMAVLAGSVTVVIYSATKSMAAFEDLPKYRVNTLAVGYRATTAELDLSMAATQASIDGEPAQQVLVKSRSLSQQILLEEQGFDQLLSHYAATMGLAAEQVGGALEWNRYVQADIQILRDSSAERQAAIQVIFDQFPAPTLLEEVEEVEEVEKVEEPRGESDLQADP